jgi:hypothetical protein
VRALMRHRSDLVQTAAQHIQHMQKSLTQVKTTAWKAVAVVTDYKSCSGRRPAQWAPHQAGFKK